MAIPLVDLKRQYQNIKDEVQAAIIPLMENASFILGKEVEDFEKEFALFCGTKYAIGTSSGTSALHLALLACGIKAQDEVITTPYTFTATAEAILYVGARPVFVDINPRDYNIDVKGIEEKITPKTKAILPVHIYGHPADMDPVLKLAKQHSLKVIEDAAQAHGAEYKGKRVGSLGDAGCFSFYPGKNLGAFGDGGAVVTNNKDIADKIKLLHNHGRGEDRYGHLVAGYNYRLDTLQAAVLRIKLRYLPDWNQKRRELAQSYNKIFSEVKLTTPLEQDYAQCVYHLYVIQIEDRDGLQKHLQAKEIATAAHYPLPLHLQKAYLHLGYHPGEFPVSEACAKRVLSLPLFPELTQEELAIVARTVKIFLS